MLGAHPRFARQFNLGISPVESNIDNFGSTTIDPSIEINDRIVGGGPANPHEYPYQVHLDFAYKTSDDSLICSGSIINALVILTAAHCFISRSINDNKVVAGDHDRSKAEGTEQLRNIERLIIHKDYDPRTKDNDIALVILSEPLEFNKYVQSIDYPRFPQEFIGSAVVTGWGKQSNGDLSSVLKKVQVPIVRKEECIHSYSSVNCYITDNMICGGGKGVDSCNGDSGGPLTCKTGIGSNKRILCGVVSFGQGCGLEFPGVYVDVSKYSRWINHMMSLSMGKCNHDQFRCATDGICLEMSKECNGVSDCADGSDETGCSTKKPVRKVCLDEQFQCVSDRSCISLSWKCDGGTDCIDGSDETGCLTITTTSTTTSTTVRPICQDDQFQCVSERSCISLSWKCDGGIDCIDGSDESGCQSSTSVLSPSCRTDQFQCESDKRCISNLWKCDGEPDCVDGSDEKGCPAGYVLRLKS